MTLTPRIETYLRELSRALSALPEPERDEIILETRSHLAERSATLSDAEAILRLGSPRELARRHLAVIPRREFGQRSIAPAMFALMIVSVSVLWLSTICSLTLCVAELVEPSLVSIWFNSSTGNVFVGAANPDMVAMLTDMAGPWFLPAAVLLMLLGAISASGMTRIVWREARAGFSQQGI